MVKRKKDRKGARGAPLKPLAPLAPALNILTLNKRMGSLENNFEMENGIEWTSCDFKGCDTKLFYLEDDSSLFGGSHFRAEIPPCQHLTMKTACKAHKNSLTCSTCHKTWEMYRDEQKVKKYAEDHKRLRQEQLELENSQLREEVKKLKKK
jgi:hypothetical protein